MITSDRDGRIYVNGVRLSKRGERVLLACMIIVFTICMTIVGTVE